MSINVPRRAWYPTVVVAGQQSSNVGFHNWYWLSVFLIFVFIILLLLIVYLYSRCIIGRRRATTGPFHVTVVAPSSEHAKPGLELSVIASIPAFSYCQAASTSGDSGGQECVVCLGTVEEGELVRMLPKCGHLFHVGCIDKWLRSHRTCPVCRADSEPPKEAAPPQAADGSNTREDVAEGRWRMRGTEQELHGDELRDIERQ